MTFDTGNRNEGMFLADVRRIADALDTLTERRHDELPPPDTDAMDLIHRLLDAQEWDSGTTIAIAEVVTQTGRKIRPVEEGGTAHE